MPSQHDREQRVPTNFRLPQNLIDEVRAAAKLHGETVTDLVIRALEREVTTGLPPRRP